MAQKPNDDEGTAEWFYQRESLEGLDWVPIYLRISELMLLRYEEFVDLLARFNETLNLLTRDEPDSVQFTVLPNSDTHMLWKMSVIIKCSRTSAGDENVSKTINISLNQFLSVYHSITQQLLVFDKTLLKTLQVQMNSTTPLTETDVQRCCICLDRQSNMELQCTHHFCSECFRRWSPHETASASQACPICRMEEDGHSDFTLVELPDSDRMRQMLIRSIISLPDSFEASKSKEKE